MGRVLSLGWDRGPSAAARTDLGSCHLKKNLGKVNKIFISRYSAEFYIYDTMLLDVSAYCYDGTNDHRLEVLMTSF